VFNIADASITTGVISILLFQKRFLGDTGKLSPISDNN